MVMDVVGVVQDLLVKLLAANIWSGGSKHIPANISTCGHRIHASFVHCSHGIFDIPLQDPMDLPCLSRCDLQRSIGKVLANVIHGNPLLSCAKATRQADSDHKTEGVFHTHLLTLFTQVTIILLVAAMGFDQFGVLEWDLTSSDVIQALLHASSQLFGLNLDLLISLHRAIITTTSSIGLINTQAREELALPFRETGVILIHILIISKSCRMSYSGQIGDKFLT